MSDIDDVSRWVDQIDSENDLDRRKATQALKNLSSTDEETGPVDFRPHMAEISQGYTDDRWRVRRNTAEALAPLFTHEAESAADVVGEDDLPTLLDQIDEAFDIDERPNDRSDVHEANAQILAELAEVYPEQVADHISRLLETVQIRRQDYDVRSTAGLENVRRGCAEALEAIASQEPQLVEEHAPELAAAIPTGGMEGVRQDIADIIQTIEWSDADAAAETVETVVEHDFYANFDVEVLDTGTGVTIEDSEVVTKTRKETQNLEAGANIVADVAESMPDAIGDSAAQIARWVGDPPLEEHDLEMWDYESANADLADALPAVAKAHPAAVAEYQTALAEALGDDDVHSEAKDSIADALGALAGADVDTEFESELVETVLDDSLYDDERANAATVLSPVAATDPAGLLDYTQDMLDVVDDAYDDVSVPVVDVLTTVAVNSPDAADDVVTAFTDLLDDKHGSAAEALSEGLGEIASEHPEELVDAVPDLVADIDAESSEILVDVAQAQTAAVADHADAFIDELDHHDDTVQENVIVIVETIATEQPEAIESSVPDLVDAVDPRFEEKSATVLGLLDDIAEDDPSTVAGSLEDLSEYLDTTPDLPEDVAVTHRNLMVRAGSAEPAALFEAFEESAFVDEEFSEIIAEAPETHPEAFAEHADQLQDFADDMMYDGVTEENFEAALDNVVAETDVEIEADEPDEAAAAGTVETKPATDATPDEPLDQRIEDAIESAAEDEMAAGTLAGMTDATEEEVLNAVETMDQTRTREMGAATFVSLAGGEGSDKDAIETAIEEHMQDELNPQMIAMEAGLPEDRVDELLDEMESEGRVSIRDMGSAKFVSLSGGGAGAGGAGGGAGAGGAGAAGGDRPDADDLAPHLDDPSLADTFETIVQAADASGSVDYAAIMNDIDQQDWGMLMQEGYVVQSGAETIVSVPDPVDFSFEG